MHATTTTGEHKCTAPRTRPRGESSGAGQRPSHGHHPLPPLVWLEGESGGGGVPRRPARTRVGRVTRDTGTAPPVRGVAVCFVPQDTAENGACRLGPSELVNPEPALSAVSRRNIKWVRQMRKAVASGSHWTHNSGETCSEDYYCPIFSDAPSPDLPRWSRVSCRWRLCRVQSAFEGGRSRLQLNSKIHTCSRARRLNQYIARYVHTTYMTNNTLW